MDKLKDLKNKIKKKKLKDNNLKIVTEKKVEYSVKNKKKKKMKFEDVVGLFSSGDYKGYKSRDELYEDRIKRTMGY